MALGLILEPLDNEFECCSAHVLRWFSRKEVGANGGSRHEYSLPFPSRVDAYGRRTSARIGPVLFHYALTLPNVYC